MSYHSFHKVQVTHLVHITQKHITMNLRRLRSFSSSYIRDCRPDSSATFINRKLIKSPADADAPPFIYISCNLCRHHIPLANWFGWHLESNIRILQSIRPTKNKMGGRPSTPSIKLQWVWSIYFLMTAGEWWCRSTQQLFSRGERPRLGYFEGRRPSRLLLKGLYASVGWEK